MLRFSRLGAVAAIGALVLFAQEMNLVKLHVDKFTVAGISVRTSNAIESTTDAKIPAMWQRLYGDNLLARIPHRVDDRVIALYTDYENGKDGMYTYILGAKVSSDKDLPGELVGREVASGQYAMFTEQGGPPPQMTVDLWKHIWSLEKPGGLERAYRTDYEVHYGEADDPAKSHVDIYIGLLGKK
ncbi:MAG: AraC family transcriptional regulator [Acidobacteriaceae bacterium]|nr:AraC family transcriptional regulator [Acidobacteriaceae bacterium]